VTTIVSHLYSTLASKLGELMAGVIWRPKRYKIEELALFLRFSKLGSLSFSRHAGVDQQQVTHSGEQCVRVMESYKQFTL
jgi:hypothetical protein